MIKKINLSLLSKFSKNVNLNPNESEMEITFVENEKCKKNNETLYGFIKTNGFGIKGSGTKRLFKNIIQ